MRIVPRRTAVVAIVLPILVAASTACDIVTADLRQSATAEWRKSYTLQSGGRIEVINVNGKIDVEPSTDNTVEIVAQKIARGATDDSAKQALERIEIKEEASPSSVRIETTFHRTGGWFEHGGAQVKYMVRVPDGADVKFSTVNGGIELSRLKGRVNAETTNGGIVARAVSGTIEASTTNGGVDVELAQVGEGGAKLECTNGGIKLRLPAEAKATISASVSNGGISTSGLDLDTSEATRRRLEARLNGGGPPIRIEGTNGGIRISAR